jgi:chromate transporter
MPVPVQITIRLTARHFSAESAEETSIMREDEARSLVCASLRILFLTMLKIGLFTFGGGFAMIALLENEFVSKKKWLEKEEFVDIVAISESTPGPIAINAATFIGYRNSGFLGSVVATAGVCIPSFVIIFAISLFFDYFLSLTVVAAAFRGIQVCVI